ncbi:MAG TPA: hypothetical protein VLJ86_15970 [Ramlibacter sp.]|nr:hypothetical protein [Ramlibacter sp.]
MFRIKGSLERADLAIAVGLAVAAHLVLLLALVPSLKWRLGDPPVMARAQPSAVVTQAAPQAPQQAAPDATRAMGSAPVTANTPSPAQPSPAATQRLNGPGPSFDCAGARSTPDRLICEDSELARLDREMARLYAQARSVAPDQAAFNKQAEIEWRYREQECRDRLCLVMWYAHRREQLQATVNQARERPRARAG